MIPYTTYFYHRLNVEGARGSKGGKGEKYPPKFFSTLDFFFLATELKRGK
jgi:hypothetical protein